MSSDAELEVLGWRDGHIVALDQTALPHEIRMLHLTTVAELVDAIGRLAIRGAPVLGAAGALGVALAARLAERDGWDAARLDAAVKQLAEARPTAVNLRRETEAAAAVIPQGAAAVEAAALAIVAGTVTASHQMSERGARYLREVCGPDPLRVETHCNTGSLACLGWGSALGVIRALNNDQAPGPRAGRRDPAAAPGGPADLLGAGPAGHRALPDRGRGRPVPDQRGHGRRGGGRRGPGGGQR